MAVETEFQQAIYDALTGDAALFAACPNIFDSAPQQSDGSAGYPHIAMGYTSFSPLDSDGTLGFSALLRVHTYTATGRVSDAKAIQALIYGVLHVGTLNMTGFECYSLTREDSDTTPLADGIAHGVCEYRAHIKAV
mgnify:CR=1 FL=1